jgi:hypothetical protein
VACCRRIPVHRYEAVQAVRPERGSKLRTVAYAALAVLVVAFVALTMHSEQNTALSAAQISAAVKRLAVNGFASKASNAGFWHRTSLSPEHNAPAQELHELLSVQESLHSFSMLKEDEVLRAMACPVGNRCRYTGVSKVEQKSVLVEYEKDSSDVSGEKMKKSKESSGSTTTTLTVTFDIWETNMTGCHSDVIAWAMNVSAVQSGDLHSTGTSETPGRDDREDIQANSTQDHQMTQALQIHPFVVTQNRATGVFIDYIVDRKEDSKNADIKRSLFKDLNPVIDVTSTAQTKVKIGARGEILFRLMERDINGHHHNVYMLKRHAGGTSCRGMSTLPAVPPATWA